MRLFFVRQPWMWGLSLTMIMLFGLFIYADKREQPKNVEQTDSGREPNIARKDAIWPFSEALSLLKKSSAGAEFPALTSTSPGMNRVQPGRVYPPGQQEELRRYVDVNQKPLALIREGVATGTFDSICSLWPVTKGPRRFYGPHTGQGWYNYEIQGVRDIPSYIRRAKWGQTPLSLKPLARLMGCSALNAVLQGDVESYLAMTDLELDTVGVLMNETILPDMLLANLDAGFIALGMTEEAVNRMNLDNGSLNHVRQKIAECLYDRQEDIGISYRNHLADCLEAVKTAREASRIPAHHYEPDSRPRFIFDNAFAVLWQQWLNGSTFSPMYDLYELRNLVRLGRYYRYGGFDNALITPEPAVEGRLLRDYISPYSYRKPPEPRRPKRRSFNAFSAEARMLRQEEQVLWPGYEDYEPYFELLAYARAADCALACAQYRNDTGMLPETPEALVPQYLRALPGDPYTYDQPLRYRRAVDRLVIYSIGPNRQDDGGKRCPKQARFHDTSLEENSMDIVFEILDGTARNNGTTDPGENVQESTLL